MSRRWVPDGSWTGAWELPPPLCVPLTDAERRDVVALSCAGVGPAKLVKEIERAGSVSGAAERHEWKWDPASRVERVDRLGVRVVTPGDAEYPELLMNTDAPPPLLYVRGGCLDVLRPCVAIVGARACTPGGARFARRVASTLAGAGFTIVSGLARGIDAAAHIGALERGATIAVLGTGIERIYPSEHRDLAEEIAVCGALVTEFPPGTDPRRWHFPARNRLIAGLAFATVVVEAGDRSGALITAGFALDYNREVLACTTGPENPAGSGVRAMLREGAALVVDPDDTAAALVDLANRHGYALPEPVRAGAPPTAEPEAELAQVFNAVLESSTVDDIVAATGLGAGRVAGDLAALELDGFVVNEGAGRYSRVMP